MPRRPKRLTRWAGRHPRLVIAGAGSVAGAAAAVVRALRRPRRRHEAVPSLASPGVVGAETAVAVHNAAKGEVVRAVRAEQQNSPQGYLVNEAVQAALSEAARSGVDLVPVAIGVVEGAIEVAGLIGESPLAAGQRAAAAALQAAEAVGPHAAERVRSALGPYLVRPHPDERPDLGR